VRQSAKKQDTVTELAARYRFNFKLAFSTDAA
jgi:hypothetical protein